MSGGLFPVFDLFIWYCWNYSNINLNRYSGQWWLRKLKAGDELKQCLIFIINLFNGSLWRGVDRSQHSSGSGEDQDLSDWDEHLNSTGLQCQMSGRNAEKQMLTNVESTPWLPSAGAGDSKIPKKWPKSNHDLVPTGLEPNTFTVLRNTGAAWDSAQTPSVMWLVVVFVQRGGASASLWQQTTHR